MDQQPDVQKQQQEHQSIQDQPNIVYIQQDPQNYRNSNYSYLNEGQNNLIGNQSFQQQNVNFGQFDNFYPFLSNGHFSPPNTSATIIQNSVDVNKCKNASEILKNSQFLSDNDSNNCHQRNEATTVQLANANYPSVDLPALNYQQPSQFFLPNLGNQYQLNDILVPAYQSSGSSESSDESSISNISQQHYPGDSSGLSNNQFEFPVPISSTGQLGRNFQQFQQKDFLDNYMALLQQENQIPRCDSSKSEAAESTCSSLSSGSTESQSENENVVRLPVLVNSLVSDNENCNILQSYQTNTQNNIASYSNQTHHNQTNEIVNQRSFNNQSEQNLVKCNSSYPDTITTNNVMNNNIGNINDVLPPNNQLNNLVVMLPNRLNKNIQNCLTTNQAMVENPSSPDTLSASKFIIQNQKVNQQRLFGIINVENQIHEDKMNSPGQLSETLKLNSSMEENSSGSIDLICRNGENNIQSCSNYSSDEDRNNGSVNNGCSAEMVHTVNNHANSDDGNDTSPFQKTSDSSVISSNFFQSNFSTKSIENDNNNSAMLLKDTSDKDMSQCINDVNSCVADTKDVYLIKNDESDIAKNVCYNDSSTNSCLTTNSTINALPVPVGWRRLLLEGSIIYLSPSNVALSSMEQVKLYLQTIGTCKCGLECPVNCDSVFNFNPKVISRPWDSSDSELTRLCNHKRKAPPIPVPSVTGVDKNTKSSRKDVLPTKRKKKRHGSGSGVSVSQLLAQRERAMAAARWSANAQPGNVSYQNVPTNQYQGIQVLRNQTQDHQPVPYENQVTDGFKQEQPAPVRLPDDKTPQFPCINVVNAPGRDGNMVNVNGLNQMVPENHVTKHELIRTSQVNQNSVSNQRQDMSQGIIGHPVNYNQLGQEFLQNAVVAPRPDGVVLAPQGMLFPPNMIMQRPRSIPPWHQARLGLNKKPVPETPVVYERIPCVQQHMPPPTLVFEDPPPPPRKKHKSSSKTKKTSQEPRQKTQPSFMDNPSAYLAQQTALLHNTISRPNFSLMPDTHPPNKLPQNLPNSSSTSERDTLGRLKSNSSSSKSTYRSHSSQKRDHQTSFSRIHTYSKSNSDKRNIRSGEVSSGTNANELQSFTDVSFNSHVCSNSNCVECKKSRLFESSSAKSNSADRQRSEKIKLIQENLEKSNSEIYSKQKYSKNEWKRMESAMSDHRRQSSSASEDQSSSIEENPVTSTTERAPVTYHQKTISDSRPIQGGTVSTSNGSPQPQPSPNSSNIFKQDVSSPKSSELPSHSPGTGNILISSSTNSSLAVSNSVCSSLLRENETVGQAKAENPERKDNVETSHYGNVNQKPLSPDDSQKYKYSNSNFASVTTTSDQKSQQNADGSEEQLKGQSVTSTFDLQKEDEKKSKNSETKGNRFVRTAASGHTVSSNTITSVQAGKTQTATVTVNNNSSTPPAISVVNFANQNTLNVPLVPKVNSQTKTPLEMVQSVVSSIQTSKNVPKSEVQSNIVSVNKAVLPTSNVLNNILTSTANINTPILASNNPGTAPVLKTSPGGLQAGHILVSSNGQYIVASSGNIIPQTNLGGLKLNTPSPMPPMSASPVVTNVTGAVTQVLPAVGVAQQVLGQPTVLVNTLPAPFVIQPGVMAVDTGLGRLAVAGNVLQSSLIENNPLRNSMRGLNPSEKSKNKKGNKKRKSQVASLVQMASPNNVILNQPFGQQNFAVSPGGNVQPLQALTLVQGKHGGPTQIVMNNQNNFNQFSPQPQQINLLQPVNLASVSNFPAFQQFIVPGLGNMVMSTDGTTTILPDTTNIGVQLQLQNVNGQNVLTPVQNTGFLNGQGILTTPAGMLIRAPNSQQKIIQNNSNPQFLSPNSGQFLVNQFQGQLSPLIAANLSPNQQIFTSSPPRQSPQEFIQIIPSSNSQNTTVVQQNTTIVQQQTTMVSNNQNILNNSGKSNFILNNSNVEKPVEVQIVGGTSQRQSQQSQQQPPSQFQQQPQSQKNLSQEKVDTGTQHSVSTQTIVSKEGNNVSVATNNTFCQTLNSNWSGSPPDTTTHSPLESESNRERTRSPSTDESPEDSVPQAMVQYVSSSMNESESENETYILPPGLPKMLTNCEGLPKSNEKAKNIVESSTILQEAGVQIQIGSNYTPSRNQKSAVDECVVSSHSDVNAQDKHIESHSNIVRYQDDKAILVDALLAETRSDDLGEEGIVDVKEKLAEGDLVWGSVRGSPAWPGKLVGPISPGGRVLVRWFGGHSSPTRVNVSQLQSLSQGLDAHHRASNKGRKNRRLNIELEAAIQEAMLELDKMAARQKKISTSGNARLRRSHR